MKRISFNEGWEFTHGNDIDAFTRFGLPKYSDATGPAARRHDHSNWRQVTLPHDWAMELPINPIGNTIHGARDYSHDHHLYTENLVEGREIFNIGWYRKQFTLSEEWKDRRVILEFEGIFRDAIVWVNGTYMTRHASGYTSFSIDITDHLWESEVNSVAVRVDSDQPEGWWYEGAGIYRNVWLLIAEPVHALPEETVIKTALDGGVSLSTVIANESEQDHAGTVEWVVLDREGKAVATASTEIAVPAMAQLPVSASLTIPSPHLWCLEEPYLYTLELRIGEERHTCRFGVRTVGFDSDRGFLLNGRPVKIRGACNHQDFGGVGVALTDNLNAYKIQRLKEMGVNAYRSAHHAPSPALLDACDELGMLVMDETRTFGTSPEALEQLTALMKRDRNHPCVFIWSLGNEEFSVQNKPISHRLMEKMTRYAKALDDTRPVTYGGNNGDNIIGANSASEIRGVNYIRNTGKAEPGESWLDYYHRAFPEQPIIGTEESSYVLSRGGIHTDLGAGELDSFGNVTMPWGSTPKGWVKFFEKRDFLSGSFMWTGFDYHGEPNPFVFTNFSSSFGTIDLCGIEKPPFYYYKAWWTDEPVLKLATHWNHTEGESVTVAVFTNCERVTLYLNGKKLETVDVERFDLPQLTIPFEAGVLEAVGTRNGKELRDRLVTAGEVETVQVAPRLVGRTAADTSIYELTALDADGNPCPLAGDSVQLSVAGGRIVAVCNGDPATTDREILLPVEQTLLINKFNGENGLYSVPPAVKNRKPFRYDFLVREEAGEEFDDDYRLVAKFTRSKQPAVTHRYTTSVVLDEPFSYIEFERLEGDVTVLVDGVEIGNNRADTWKRRPYRFYHDFGRGRHEIEVSANVNEVTGSLTSAVISGTVKLGKLCEPDWRVRLHYGKAIVLVRSEHPEDVTLHATRKGTCN